MLQKTLYLPSPAKYILFLYSAEMQTMSKKDKHLQESYEDVYEMILSSSADSEQEQHVNYKCVCAC